MPLIPRRQLLAVGAGTAAAMAAMRSAKADQAYSSYAYPLSGATGIAPPYTPSSLPVDAVTTRSTLRRFTDVLNILDFGADPTGANDSTSAIQKCFDAAYGPASNPHGGFINGNGPPLDPMFTNKAVFIPVGFFKTSATLLLTSVYGAHIFGAGKGNSIIQNNSSTAADAVIRTDRAQFCHFHDFACSVINQTTVHGTCFDLDMISTSPANSYAAQCNLQSNTFTNMRFSGGDYGLRINNSVIASSMGSENSCVNCFFQDQSIAGLMCRGQNALMNSVFGGDFASNLRPGTKGIYVPTGSIPMIHGVSFQVYGTGSWDIRIESSNPDTYSIAGCRSEGPNFVFLGNSPGAAISGCAHLDTTGSSLHAEGPNPNGPGNVSVDSCYLGGTVTGNAILYIRGADFQNSSPFSGFNGRIAQLDMSHLGGTALNTFSGSTLVPALPVATLTSAVPAAYSAGLRYFVTDADQDPSVSTNFGKQVTHAGAGPYFTAPVFSDGATWRIG